MSPSIHNLPKYWTKKQRRLFKRLHTHMGQNQPLYNAHPEGDLLSRNVWETVAWNAAWMAADGLKK